jgi:hypothetical protein
VNKRLSEAIEQIEDLPDERQQRAASLLLDILEEDDAPVELSAEQRAEIEDALSDDEEIASEDEVRTFFARLLG